MCNTETVKEKRDHNKEIRGERQGNRQIPKGTETETPLRRQPWTLNKAKSLPSRKTNKDYEEKEKKGVI